MGMQEERTMVAVIYVSFEGLCMGGMRQHRQTKQGHWGGSGEERCEREKRLPLLRGMSIWRRS